ncbi:MAG: hypothetical protein KDA83_11450 [Planctomycetales bacterium]|nr:hypothetical protein [Planctomycetales bacterium]
MNISQLLRTLACVSALPLCWGCAGSQSLLPVRLTWTGNEADSQQVDAAEATAREAGPRTSAERTVAERQVSQVAPRSETQDERNLTEDERRVFEQLREVTSDDPSMGAFVESRFGDPSTAPLPEHPPTSRLRSDPAEPVTEPLPPVAQVNHVESIGSPNTLPAPIVDASSPSNELPPATPPVASVPNGNELVSNPAAPLAAADTSVSAGETPAPMQGPTPAPTPTPTPTTPDATNTSLTDSSSSVPAPGTVAAETTATETTATELESMTEADWLTQVDTGYANLERLLAREQENMSQAARERLEIRLRLLALALGDQDKALRTIESLDPALREYWKEQLFAMGTLIEPNEIDFGSNFQFGDRRKLAMAIDHLRQAELALAAESALRVHRVAICDEVRGFGNFHEFPRTTFEQGQAFVVYCEVENFRSERQRSQLEHGEVFATEFVASLVFFDGDRKMVKQIDYAPISDEARHQRRDMYLHFTVTIPDDLPSGRYYLSILLEDAKAEKSANSAPIEFEIR